MNGLPRALKCGFGLVLLERKRFDYHVKLFTAPDDVKETTL